MARIVKYEPTPEQHDIRPGLAKTLPLLRKQPQRLRVVNGYLDLLPPEHDDSPGGIQSLWVSGIGSRVYDKVQALGRQYVTASRPQFDELRITAGDRVLDVGCGPGDITARLGHRVGPNGLVVGLDVSKPMLRTAARQNQQNLAFVRADAMNLPFDDGEFDSINTVFVLQLIPGIEQAFAEMVRVLRPGGRLCAVVPGDDTASDIGLNRIAGAITKVRMYSAAELSALATRHGLTEVRGRSLGIAQVMSATKPKTAKSPDSTKETDKTAK